MKVVTPSVVIGMLFQRALDTKEWIPNLDLRTSLGCKNLREHPSENHAVLKYESTSTPSDFV